MSTPTTAPIIGHAIVSEDGAIADHHGLMPPPLRNPADWRLFQAALDASSVVVVGRKGHERHPNPGRRRLVVTGAVAAFEPIADGTGSLRWNPDGCRFSDLVARLDPPLHRALPIAVTGGRGVFDLFLGLGFDGFDLSIVQGYRIADGIACFSQGSPATVLAAAGLTIEAQTWIDPAAGVLHQRWRRRPP